MHGAFGMQVLKIGGRRANLLFLAQKRSIRFMLRNGFKDRVMAIKAKVRVNHPKIGDTSRLLVSHGKGHVSIATSLDT